MPRAAGGDATCTANLTCARPVAAGNSTVKDVECFAGAVCSCGVPVQGMFVSCGVPECFPVYDSMMATIQGAIECDGDQSVKAIMLDIACQFGPSFKTRFSHSLPELLFRVGWLHSKAGHNLACQLKSGGEFTAGLGRCIGEAIEQLWVSDILCPSMSCINAILLKICFLVRPAFIAALKEIYK